MRYVQLRAFHNVAIHGGFSRAAEALFLTQPAISDQVRKLEQEYDILLFNRRKKQISLTRQGQKLLEITNLLFETERQAAEMLSESRALGIGKLNIVADSIAHILPVLTRFRKQYPRIKIEVHTGNSEEIAEKLHAYQADVGVIGGVPDVGEFEAIKLNSTRLVAYVSRHHELSGRKKMTLEQILQYPLVLREKGSKTRQMFEEIVNKRSLERFQDKWTRLSGSKTRPNKDLEPGFGSTKTEMALEINPVIEAEGRDAVGEIVAGGAGVGIISAAELGGNSRLSSLEISDCEIAMDETLVCLKERKGGKLIKEFMRLAKREISRMT